MRIGRRSLILLVVASLVVGYLFLTGAAPEVARDGDGTTDGRTPASEQGERRGQRSGPAEQPFVLLSPVQVTQPATINLAGYRFAPDEDVQIVVRPDGSGQPLEIGWATADENGQIAGFTFGLPEEVGPGAYTVEATGQTEGGKAQARLEVTQGSTWIALEPYAVKPGDQIAFRGGGFIPGEEVTVHLNSLDTETLASASVSAVDGLLAGQVAVPFAGSGDNALLFVGRESQAVARTTFTVLGFTPYALLGNYTPQPQQTMGLAGDGFVPGETVLVYLNEVGAEPVATLQADAHGRVLAEDAFTVPLGLRGENSLIFVGVRSQVEAPAEFEVMPPTPSLELTIYAVRPGASVAFIGRDFAQGETMRAYIGNPKPGAEVSVFEAGEDGAFEGAGEFRLPYTIGGEGVTLTVVGDDSEVVVEIELGVIGPEPGGQLSPYHGLPGSEVQFSGYGFGAGEEIAVYVGDGRSQPVATARADEDGNFEDAGPYRLPADTAGTLRFSFVGEQTGAEAKAELTVGEEEPAAEGPALEAETDEGAPDDSTPSPAGSPE